MPMNSIRTARRSTALFALLTLAVSLAVLAPVTASAISRNSVLSRGQSWVDKPVPYSQKKKHLGYRTDCSGYVSMCWKTGTSWSTRSFHAVTHKIPLSALKPGDALLKKGYHIRLFYGWVDDAHTQYVAYEANTVVAVCRIHSMADDLAFGYIPTRYDHVTDSAKSRNLLRNGSFDVWARSWGSQPEEPVWWQHNGPWGQTIAAHRKDTARTSKSSLMLTNPSSDAESFTELSQAASVTAGVEYRLTAYATSATVSEGVELHLAYLDAAGATVAETSTTGASAGISGSTFKRMSLLLASPADAVRALVTVRLAGGTSTNASGTLVPGTAVTLDDISLSRPQVSVSIKTSATAARTGTTITLSGTVTPASSVGATATVYVQVPGSPWKQLSTTPVYASGSAGAWKRTFHFTRSMHRGAFHFRTSVPAIPGYLGATTSSASVKLK